VGVASGVGSGVCSGVDPTVDPTVGPNVGVSVGVGVIIVVGVGVIILVGIGVAGTLVGAGVGAGVSPTTAVPAMDRALLASLLEQSTPTVKSYVPSARLFAMQLALLKSVIAVHPYGVRPDIFTPSGLTQSDLTSKARKAQSLSGCSDQVRLTVPACAWTTLAVTD
jgi:hypothetical protein